MELQSNSNHLSEKHVTSLKIHIELKAPNYYEKKFTAVSPMMKKPPPALIKLQFISNHLK